MNGSILFLFLCLYMYVKQYPAFSFLLFLHGCTITLLASLSWCLFSIYFFPTDHVANRQFPFHLFFLSFPVDPFLVSFLSLSNDVLPSFHTIPTSPRPKLWLIAAVLIQFSIIVLLSFFLPMQQTKPSQRALLIVARKYTATGQASQHAQPTCLDNKFSILLHHENHRRTAPLLPICITGQKRLKLPHQILFIRHSSSSLSRTAQ